MIKNEWLMAPDCRKDIKYSLNDLNLVRLFYCYFLFSYFSLEVRTKRQYLSSIHYNVEEKFEDPKGNNQKRYKSKKDRQ